MRVALRFLLENVEAIIASREAATAKDAEKKVSTTDETGKNLAPRIAARLFVDEEGNLKATEIALVGIVVACAWLLIQDNGAGRLSDVPGLAVGNASP